MHQKRRKSYTHGITVRKKRGEKRGICRIHKWSLGRASQINLLARTWVRANHEIHQKRRKSYTHGITVRKKRVGKRGICRIHKWSLGRASQINLLARTWVRVNHEMNQKRRKSYTHGITVRKKELEKGESAVSTSGASAERRK